MGSILKGTVMTAVPKPKLTEAEYLAIENAAEFRGEYVYGQRIELPDTEPRHNLLKAHMIALLGLQLFQIRHRSYSTTQRVRVSDAYYTYPDIVIVDECEQFFELDPNTLTNPRIVVEVLSPLTELHDRGFKFVQYRQQPSIREYVLVAHDAVRIERFVRQSHNSWLLTVFTDPNGEFSLGTIPVRDSMSDVYRHVAFPKEATP